MGLLKETNWWRLKVPLKINIFMWYMHKEVVFTKDNLAKRNWNGGKQCSFCLKDNLYNISFTIAIVQDLFGG
jgi:hypothetical protein